MSIRRSLLNSALQQYFVLLIQFVSTIIIARLLTPAEIGIYSVGAALVAVAHIIRDFGITAYVIQDPDLDAKRIRTAFTITLIIGAILGTTLLLVSPWLASFYSEQGVREVLTITAFNFFLIPFGSVSMALLRRGMRFDVTLRIGVASAFGHAVTGVTLAYFGYGYMSLAWAAFAGVLIQVVTALLNSPQRFVGWPTLSERHRVLGFGGRVGLANVASEAGHASQDIVIGRILGFEQLGYFNRALGFVQLIEKAVIDALRPVVLPYLSKQHGAGHDLQPSYSLSIANLTGVVWPACAMLALFAAPLINILYGHQWLTSIPIAHLLCVAVAARSLGVVTSATLTARGNVKDVLNIGLIAAMSKICSVLVLAQYGIYYAAMGYVAAELLTNAIAIHIVNKRLALGFFYLFTPMFRSLVVAGLSLAFTLLILLVLGVEVSPQMRLVTTGMCCLIAGVSWLLALWLCRHPLIKEIAQIKKKFVHR